MGISSLRLKGFKSFGRQCEFEFSRNFTAIVGPNGSGKSNILDALKWILGEGTSSGLRITKQSDLIFQGSNSTPQADNAEVLLRLANENEKCTLRRTYSRDSGGMIFADGRRILLQDIDSVKAHFNLSGEGFALIGQGEISETIHQRPAERRRQLDSLFGIELYRVRRDESVKKLDESKNEAQRIQTLIDELNTRREEISDDVNAAVQAKGIIDNLDVLRQDYYFFRRYSNEKEQADLEIRKHIEESKLEALNEWLNIWTHGQKHYEALMIPNEDDKSYLSQLGIISSKKDSIHRRAFQLSSNLHSILKRRTSLTEGLITLKARRESLEHDREQKRIEYESVSHEAESKQKELSEREEILSSSQRDLREKIQRRRKVIDDIAKLKLKRSETEAAIHASEASCESGLQEIHELEEEYERKQNIVDGLIAQKDSLEKKFAELTSKCNSHTSELQNFRSELSRLEMRYSDLENSVIPSSGVYPEPVRALMAASDKRILKSQFILAADAFTCPSQESAGAIEAYLGARQFWLFVRTLEEAREGIEYLKANRLGRATYLALENSRPKKHDSRLNFSGKIIGWAMDLISVKNEWHDAVSQLIGDLLVVEDYETAAVLIRSGAKYPVVTVEGEVFTSSGTVSGGASRHKYGAVTARQKQEEINEEIRVLTAKISDTRNDIEERSETVKTLKHQCEQTSGTLERIKSDVNYEQRNLKIIHQNLERMTKEHDSNEKRIASLQEEYNASESQIESLEAELHVLGDIHEDDYGTVIQSIRNELNLLRERVKLSKALYEHSESEYLSVLSEIMSAESEIESGIITENESRNLLRELSQEKKQAYSEEQRIRHEILRINNASSESRKHLEHIRLKLGRINERISAQKNRITETANKLKHLEAELTQLIELWDFKYPYNLNEAKNVEGGRELTSLLRKLERELKALGTYNLGALSEDESLAERIDFLTVQLDDVNTASDELRTLIDDTDTQVEHAFTDALSKIDDRFNSLFQRLFGGGEARLRLQDGESIWDRGVEIFARPPGKKLQNISQLSGGEQSLTSIALIFAALESSGTPLAVLDEVDAALDEYNLIRFADLAKEYSESIQIIAMTHRRTTMERADLIYGVTMIEPGLTSMIGIDPKNYV